MPYLWLIKFIGVIVPRRLRADWRQEWEAELRRREELLAELRRQFATLPGTNVTIGQPISHRIDHMLSGTRANIAVKVFGDDLRTLRRLLLAEREDTGRAFPRRHRSPDRASGGPRSRAR